MQLKLKRSQRSAGMMGGKVLFGLDARVQLTAEERSLVDRYKLGKQSVYDSENRKKFAAAAGANLDAAGAQSDSAFNLDRHSASAAGSAVYRFGKGMLSAAMAGLSLRVTIDSLAGGQHIECKDLDELLGAEAAIREACQNVKGYLDTALTFDGREEVIEF